MEVVVSGIRSTGSIHLGNYFGAVKNFIRMQDEFKCYFFVADYHSLTTHPKADELHASIKKMLAQYLAFGLDPDKANIYVQSDVPEIPELYLILNMLAYKGELERVPTFKEKIRDQKNINAGLLTYPVLMAADILVHKADKVPVGKDQEQHLELTRTYGNRFNSLYEQEVFPEPQAFNYGGALVKVPSLDNSGKMSASGSAGNAIFFDEEEKAIRKKIMRAVTDSGPTVANSEKPEAIQNIFDLLKLVSEDSVISELDAAYNDCSIRYGDLKKQLADDVVDFMSPIQDRMKEIESDPSIIKKALEKGTEAARESARKTLADVRHAIGIRSLL